jgi:catechol 2,3-dioxygenase-like lactoylglutathione lyase family enzyme
MFTETKAFSSFSVDHLDRAKEFYGRTLGLRVKEEEEGLEVRLGTGAVVFIYESAPGDYTPPEHTVLNFVVDDIDAAIDALAEKGIRMEQYDLPGIKTDERGIFRGKTGPKAIAWFKDPAEHILAVLQEK